MGFEPTVLSHTAFRERHLKPLGHLSTSESSKATRRCAEAEPWTEHGRPGSGAHAIAVEVRPQLGGDVAEDARDDVEPARQAASAGQADGRAARPLGRVGQREDEAVGVCLLECTHAHRARLHDREDREARQRGSAQARGGLAYGDDNGVRGRVTAAAHRFSAVRHHGLVDDGHSAVGAFTGAGGLGGLGERCPHVQLVVHRPRRLPPDEHPAGACAVIVVLEERRYHRFP